ncbi:flagellar hook-length control protein FliK [Sulfurivermis fontis]|uniref:flagellar hook-length control protein FliK n=1 Tax=Sulfurivermis fontis TaxID=1972068 RepID=UPI000FD74E88|nr:flagellar hook-length control protein FliK [Sulfurivermis fontis]
MLNAKSGISEMLLPVGGGGSARRQETGSADDSGLFGDTLKGQMQQAAEAQKPASRETERPAQSAQKAAADAGQQPVKAESDIPVEVAQEDAEAVAASDGATEELVVELAEDGLPVQTLSAESFPATEPEVAAGGNDLPAETDAGGKILPLPLTQFPSPQADARADVPPEEGALEELPRWLHSLAAAGRGREQAVAGRTEEPGLLAAEDGVQDGAFLKGLQAVTAQMDGQRSDMGGRQPGQGAETFFKLAGLTVVKEAPPPLSLAASTVSAAAAATTAPTSAAPAAAVPTLALDVPLRQAGWDQAMAERVVWMAKQGVQEAQIHLNPRNMGPIEVHVSVQKDQASVAFVAQHAMTREALDAAMPRLRDMLQDSGLNLAQAEVSQHDRQREQAAGFAGGQGRGQHAHGGHAAGDDVVVAQTPLRSGGLGAVDYYA